MKAMRKDVGLWMVLGAWCVAQWGCGVASDEQTPVLSARGGLMGDLPFAATRAKAGAVRSTQMKVQAFVGNQQILAEGARYRRLYPVGLWKGSWKHKDQTVFSMTLDLRGKEGADLRSVLRKMRTQRSLGASLLGTAHACGPYGEEMRLAAVARWSVTSAQWGGALDGDVVTYDDFQHSAGFNLRGGGVLLSGSVFVDYKTQKRKVAGSVTAEKKAEDGKISYEHLGNFDLEQVDKSSDL